MKTLVTGASGFVGSAVARQMIDAGHEVRVLVRPASDRRNLQGLAAEIVEGDLRDAGSLQKAVRGCSHLFHVAADYRLWIPDPQTMYEINVEATRNLLRAAGEAGVSQIVYTSSVATLGCRDDGSPADENTPTSLAMMIGHYKRSKFLAEQEVLRLVENEHLPVIIVNPSTPIGPRDIRPTPTGRIVLDVLRGNMPAYLDTGLNIVHVDDVARGHLLACAHGKYGERYILGGENHSLRAILEMIAEIADVAAPRLRLPHNVVLPAAWLMEKWAYVSGREPRATVDSIRMARKYMYFSCDRAMRELGYRYRPAREAVKDAVDWFRNHDYCG